MGSRVIKKTKNAEYLYYSYYDAHSGKKVAKYCGAAADPESQKRAEKFEIADLKAQMRVIRERLERLRGGQG